MSYLLDGTEIKAPANLRRDIIEIEKSNTTLNGKKKRDFIRQKYSYTIDLKNLTQAQFSIIKTIIEGKAAVTFQVTETNLTVAETNVWVYLQGEDFVKGGEYRENITLILEEV